MDERVLGFLPSPTKKLTARPFLSALMRGTVSVGLLPFFREHVKKRLVGEHNVAGLDA